MHLCIQLDWFPGSASGRGQPSQMQVDWVRQYPITGTGPSPAPINADGTCPWPPRPPGAAPPVSGAPGAGVADAAASGCVPSPIPLPR